MQLFEDVASRLKLIYKQKILPLERRYKFHDVHSPAFLDADFDAKPTILLLGQYSSGKTTFIKYVLQSDFPGARIGPEPTTDKFIAVTYGNEDRRVPRSGKPCRKNNSTNK
jgi:EH domain-containing protein 1